MKIAYLARRPLPSRHAHAVQIVGMCEAFGQLGHEVDLFATPGDGPADSVFGRYGVERCFRIHHRPRRAGPATKWRHVLAVLRAKEVRGADLLFGRDILSLTACSGLGIPLVYEAHIIPPRGSPRWRKLRRLFRSPNFSHLVCVTSTLAEEYRAQFPELASKPVLVVPNAASNPHDDGAALQWPGRPGRLQVGFAGRPFPGKGIEAMAGAAGELPEVDFHIIGADRAEVSWLEGDLPRNLHFHGYQPHGALGRFYRYLDLAAAPYGETVQNASGMESGRITSPLKLAEYMAAGLPSIVSDLPGVRDMLGGSDAALLIAPGDAGGLAAAVRKLTDPTLRGKMATAARTEYEARHTSLARARTVLQPLLTAGQGAQAETEHA